MGLFNKKKEELTRRTFKCKDCNMEFDDKERLKKHSKKTHSEKGGHMTNPNPFGGF